MSFIPEEELKGKGAPNMAPMIDFLFIMLMFFASLAISRVTLKETEIDLVKLQNNTEVVRQESDIDYKVINITITKDGTYKWVTEIHDYPMATAEAISDELNEQYEKGLLPEDKLKTQVLLKIDKKAQWEPIMQAIFAIRESGFTTHPVYEPEEEKS